MNILRRSIICCVAAFALLSSCDLMKAGLSSSLDEVSAITTGTASIVGDTWYYAGGAGDDVSADTEYLTVSFSKVVALESSTATAPSGSLALSYTDLADGSDVTKTFDISGSFNSTRTEYYINMGSILDLLDGATITDGTASLIVTMNGLLCDEGTNTGFQLPTMKETIAIEPLFVNATSKATVFSTYNSTIGSSASIATNAVVSIASGAASPSLVAASGSTLPTDFDISDLVVAVASDGLSIVVSTPSFDLLNQNFTIELTVPGLKGPLASNGNNATFTIKFSSTYITLDGAKDSTWSEGTYVADSTSDAMAGGYSQSGCELSGLYINNDGTYLYVAFEVSSLSNFWNNDSFNIYIDSPNTTAGVTDNSGLSSAWCRSADTMTFTNGQADIVLWHNPGTGSGTGQVVYGLDTQSGTDSILDNWTATPSHCAVSPMGFYHDWQVSTFNYPTFVEYRITLADVGLAKNDVIKVFGVLSVMWSDTYHHAVDIIPGGTPSASDNVTFDFSTAQSYTIK